MRRWARYTPLLLVAFGIGFLVAPGPRRDRVLPNAAVAAQTDQSPSSLRDVSRDGRLLSQILTEIWRGYYRDVNSTEVTIGALKGMMTQLDPYSEYFSQEMDESEVADLEITTTGQYSGIGATIGQQGGVLTVVAPMKGSPAERTGLQAGDVIARIDGTPSRTFTSAKAASLIKGPEGTQVTLMIEREGFPEPMAFEITRETIEVNDVSAAVFAAPGIAYIEIGRFTRNTGRFLTEALEKLEKEQRIEGLILDLRGNPGGLLLEAREVAEPFLPAGEMVVYTRGRISEMNSELRTSLPQRYRGRMSVLINTGSASASEIVAGAIQDLDRGVVVGRNSFGKGLVQSVAPVGDGNYLRLTTGEYFTPSGRNLQRPFIEDEQGILMVPNPTAPDTAEHPAFRSRNGREVKGGGGVRPDIEIEGMTGDILLFDLKFRRAMFLRYVNNYVNTRSLEAGSQVRVDEALLDDFQTWCLADDFTFRTPTEVVLEDLERTATAEDVATGLRDEIAALKRAIEVEKEKMWQKDRAQIALELRREFVTRLRGYEAGQMEYFKEDPQFQDEQASPTGPLKPEPQDLLGDDEVPEHLRFASLLFRVVSRNL
jgi:carboxyl-terminal processing protease